MPNGSDVTRTRDAPTVLLVENNNARRALIRDLVEPIAGTIHECQDGMAAVQAYGRLRPDWVLMDIGMDGLDGIAATRAIRQLDPHARIIIVTEHGGDDFRRASKTAGACGFVLKRDLLDLPALVATFVDGGEE